VSLHEEEQCRLLAVKMAEQCNGHHDRIVLAAIMALLGYLVDKHRLDVADLSRMLVAQLEERPTAH